MRANAAILVVLAVLLAGAEGVRSSETISGPLTDLFSCSECKLGHRKLSSFVELGKQDITKGQGYQGREPLPMTGGEKSSLQDQQDLTECPLARFLEERKAWRWKKGGEIRPPSPFYNNG